ncbi:arylsulfatase [Lignipirellula cremea]|uniref:arylsulfatase n=1 Tax=Lignipirellula cremea TaxID=2528010 RepID=UPI0021BC7FBC|nr:arylsulfatase [Lignipirellula cremea]
MAFVAQVIYTQPVNADQASRPNIVLIMADDMGFSDIGCYGGEVKTPNLDSMAKDGLRFLQFYNNAKCTTTRASLVTGLYPRPRGGLLKTNMVTLGEALKTAGYQTSLSGKWHLGSSPTTHPFHRGFDRYYGLLDGCCNFFNPVQPDPKFKGGKVRKFGRDDQKITEFPDDYYTTDAFTDHAVESIHQFAAANKPFFVHVCYTAPHYPLHAKPADIAKYRGKFRMGWYEMRKQRLARQIAMGIIDPKWDMSSDDSRAYSWETANQDWEDLRMAVYAAMIDSMDQNIGRLLKALDETGVADNTVVMFLSDNGGCAEEPGGRNTAAIPGPKEFYTAVGPAWGWAQNAPFCRYKSWVHEGGISTPFIVRWPAQTKADGMTQQVGHIIDIMATCMDLAGKPYPEEFQGQKILPLEGTSLAPVFRGDDRSPPAELCWEWSGNRAVRQGNWKCVWDSRIKKWELYDMQDDRTETRNLAEKFPDRTAQMSRDWMAWAERTGAPH